MSAAWYSRSSRNYCIDILLLDLEPRLYHTLGGSQRINVFYVFHAVSTYSRLSTASWVRPRSHLRLPCLPLLKSHWPMHVQPLSPLLFLGQREPFWTDSFSLASNPTWTDSFSLASLSFCCASGEIVASAWVKSRVCSVPARGCVSASDDEPSLAVRGSLGASRIARASTSWQVQRL